MIINIEHGQKGISANGRGGVVIVPFSVIHRCRRFIGRVEVPVGGCEKQAAILWEKDTPLISELRMGSLRSAVIGAALGTDNACRFNECPQRR